VGHEPFDCCVVIVNYNGGALLQRVRSAAEASTGLRLRLVVVDNASTDGSIASLLQERAAAAPLPAKEHVLILQCPQNRGFSAGNNLGLFGMAARYVLLLNCDAVVEPTTLATLVAFMDSHPTAGACAPRLCWPNGESQPYSYGGDPTPLYLFRRLLAHRAGRQLHAWDGRKPKRVDWVAATCILLRPKALATIGLLDEGIFMYFEDNDLCLRLRKRGWKIYFVPTTSVRHHNKPSFADRKRRASYANGLARFYSRHYGFLAGVGIQVLMRLRRFVSP